MAAAGLRIRISQALMAAGRKLTQRAAEKSEEILGTALDAGKQVYDTAKNHASEQGASSSRRSSTVPRHQPPLDVPRHQPPLDVDIGAHPSRRWKALSCFRGERSIGGEDAAAKHNHARPHNYLCGFDDKVHSNFLEYITSFFGYDLNLMVAVDFTGTTIKRVGGPIQMSASDKRFHAWGFGGVVVNGPEQNDEVSHAFNLNGMAEVVVGVDGILSAYSIACTDVAQSRPIQFSGVVNRTVDIVSASPHKKYYVLLIITTGAPTDMPATVEALVRGAELPLSVLIVSLGDADLAELENELLAQGGIRDFVKFGSLSDVIDGRLLTAIPKHFISHIRYKRIDPRGSFTDLEILPLL
ncbi:hypothetical protein Bca4012_095291 [Brassica carinata]